MGKKPAATKTRESATGGKDLWSDSAARLEALLHHVNDLVYAVSIDPDAGTWRLEFLSDRIRDLSGCRAEEFVQGGFLGSGGPFGLKDPDEHAFELIHPDDAPEALEATRTLSSGVRVTREYRVRNRRTGEYRWVEDRSEPEKDDKGRVVGIWGIVRDITERRQRENALRELAAIVAVSDDAIIGLDLEGRVLSWNPAAARTYGFTPNEAEGKPFFDLVAPERAETLNAQVRELGAGGHFKEDDALHRTRDGVEIPVSMTASAISGPAGEMQMVAVVVRDLTERKQLELQLMQFQKMEAVGRLAGGIAHDFNNILTIILGQSETLIDDLSNAPGTGPLVEDAQSIRSAAARAAALTRQLLAFSRKQLLQPRPLTLDAAVEEMQGMLERLIGEDIELRIVTGKTGTVQADPSQLQQVLMNLVVNARDAMPGGGRLLIETAEVDLDPGYSQKRVGSRPGRYAMLAVSDTGVGMDWQTVQQAFDPFFTTKAGGTGLGLSTVYGIIKQSGGNVWAYSEVGKGTTVKVYLPRIDGDPPAEQNGTGESGRALRGDGTILVVEDEDGVRKLIRSTLESYGYTVLEASNGLDACRAAEEHHDSIELVVTDLVMPMVGGIELVRRIRERRPDIRVLYTSGYTDGFVAQDGVREELGSSFLQKPFTKADLARRVQEVLAEGG